MAFVSPDIQPLADAVRRMSDKTPVGATLNSEEWERVPLALRERAFFSATVENVRALATMQDKLRKRAALIREQGAHGSAHVGTGSFISDVKKVLREEGIAPTSGGLRDITSAQRLKLIYDHQTSAAANFARWKTGQDSVALDNFPAQELSRVEDRKVERDWNARWASAGGQFYAGRMIALKTDPVWQKISRFGTPWPPFDYGSGMGVESISREEAEQLGVIEHEQHVEPILEDFNAQLEASAKGLEKESLDDLELAFGDRVEIAGDTVKWRQPGSEYKTFADYNLVPSATWRPTSKYPHQISLAEAHKLLEKGHAVQTDIGEVVFDKHTLAHWSEYDDRDIRPTYLPHAVKTVQEFDEQWIQEEQYTFVKSFNRPDAKYKGCVVAVNKHTHIAVTYFVQDLKRLDNARHGIGFRVRS